MNKTLGDAQHVSGNAQNSSKNDVLESVSDVSGVSPEQKRDILTLGKAGVSRRQVSLRVLGSKGAPYANVKATLDEVGL